MDAKPEPHHFPLRNRIISGMSIGTVVVEAARRSGSLITARLAVEQNREVFAVPGSVHAQTARGTHELIKQGAKLVENVSDILEEVLPQWVRTKDTTKNTDDTNDTARVPKALPELSNEEKGILNLIGPYPIHIDELARTQGLTMGRFISILSQLELKGIICQEPGKYFVRNKDYMNRF
jgi:DNA processing protein